MSWTVSTQVIECGTRGVCVFLASSGATEDLTAQLILDISALSGVPSGVKIVSVRLATNACVAKLLWDQTVDEMFASAVTGQVFSINYKQELGAPLRGKNTGGSGDILLTTLQGNSASIAGTIVFEKII